MRKCCTYVDCRLAGTDGWRLDGCRLATWWADSLIRYIGSRRRSLATGAIKVRMRSCRVDLRICGGVGDGSAKGLELGQSSVRLLSSRSWRACSRTDPLQYIMQFTHLFFFPFLFRIALSTSLQLHQPCSVLFRLRFACTHWNFTAHTAGQALTVSYLARSFGEAPNCTSFKAILV